VRKDTAQPLKDRIVANGRIPKHIAFIMDGNGRWANRRGLPRTAGHHQGVKTVRRMVEIGPEIGVKVMTFFTFSTENWNRPKFEVSALMQLLLDSINKELDDLKRNDVSVQVIGDLNALPEGPRNAMERAIEETADNKRLKLVLALSYSGRAGIHQAVARILADDRAGKLKQFNPATDLSNEFFSQYLDTSGLPDPDLLIRTSGEQRLSNFLLYQLAYTEIVVTGKFWPEFQADDLYNCIADYQKRERRFGKTSDQVHSGNRS
jgi:undecaprenyl diphosphate synthase